MPSGYATPSRRPIAAVCGGLRSGREHELAQAIPRWTRGDSDGRRTALHQQLHDQRADPTRGGRDGHDVARPRRRRTDHGVRGAAGDVGAPTTSQRSAAGWPIAESPGRRCGWRDSSGSGRIPIPPRRPRTGPRRSRSPARSRRSRCLTRGKGGWQQLIQRTGTGAGDRRSKRTSRPSSGARTSRPSTGTPGEAGFFSSCGLSCFARAACSPSWRASAAPEPWASQVRRCRPPGVARGRETRPRTRCRS